MCKKINRFVYILTDFGIGSLVIFIYIGHYFLPIAYVIFILTQRLVPVDKLPQNIVLCPIVNTFREQLTPTVLSHLQSQI